MKQRTKTLISRVLAVIAAVLMSTCHAFYSGPVLWKQGSSAAFDIIVAGAVICIAALFVSITDLFKKDYISRDDVLYAFHEECERPTAADIVIWAAKYPQFAEDIRTHAAIARDMNASTQGVEATTQLLDKAYDNALKQIQSKD